MGLRAAAFIGAGVVGVPFRWIALVGLVAGAYWIYSAFRPRAERELAGAAHPAP